MRIVTGCALGLALVLLVMTAMASFGATTTDQHDYWQVQTNDSSPDSGAYTWAGAEDGELGDSPTPDSSPILLTVYYHADDAGTCVPSIAVAFDGQVVNVAAVNLQAGRGEAYSLERKSVMDGALTSGVVPTADVTTVLEDIRTGTGADVDITTVAGVATSYVLSLLGATAATDAARNHCERLAESSE